MVICENCGEATTGKFCQNCGQSVKTISETDIKNTVDKLYGLRAGLSLISVKKDVAEEDLDEIEGEIKSEKYRLDEIEEKILPPLAETLEKVRNKDKFEKQKDEAKKNVKGALIKLILYWALMIIVGTVAVVSDLIFIGIFFYSCAINNRYNPPETLTIVCFFVGIALSPLTYLLVYLYKKIDFYGEYCSYYSVRDSAIRTLAEIEKNKGIEKTFNRETQKTIDLKQSIEILEDKRIKKEEGYSIFANEAYDALKTEYSTVIDVRDWENLDLIIYYFETGRAETMKEALQLVDRQVQTNEIVTAIELASRRICLTIQEGMSKINNTIISATMLLSSQINSVTNQLSSINANLTITANAMKQALTSKADVSSKQLMDDVHQMRLLADNEEVRRRNS